MGPKISGAKTHPLRKLASLSLPSLPPLQLVSPLLCIPCLLFNTSHKNHCFTHKLGTSLRNMHFFLCCVPPKCLFKLWTCLWWQNVSLVPACISLESNPSLFQSLHHFLPSNCGFSLCCISLITLSYPCICYLSIAFLIYLSFAFSPNQRLWICTLIDIMQSLVPYPNLSLTLTYTLFAS